MKVRSEWLVAIGVFSCNPSGTSSTGVGNPSASFSLLVVNDDGDPTSAAGADGENANAGARNGAGAPSTDPAIAEGGAGGSMNSGSPEAGSGGDPSDEAPLERAQVMHAMVSLGELRFLPCDPNLPGHVTRGPFVIDLVRSVTLPKLPKVPGVEGGYCGIDAPLAPAKQPATLAGRSLFFDGVRADGVRFLLFADMQATLRLRALPTAGWRADETPNLLWAMRPRRWLNRKEVDSADAELLDGAKTIVIDVDRHPLLYARIRARLAGRSALYPDSNMNEVVDPDERLRELGIGLENAD